MAKNILIIGNGFDIYHKLPTRYNDFMFFCKCWISFYEAYKKHGYCDENQPINVPLGEHGELTEAALIELGKHGDMMNPLHIEYINQHIMNNPWIHYFQELQMAGNRWLDFENEIQNALYAVEEYCMVITPTKVGETATENESDRIVRVANIFGEKARDYIDFSQVKVIRNYTDKEMLQKNKEALISHMNNEMNIMIQLLQYYLSEFVANINPTGYSEQIKQLGEVDVLNFNYTLTYKNIYGKNLQQHHAVHGGIVNGDIVLGIADDAFSDTYDYIRFQKYFQRIQKRTGSYYRDWLNYYHENNGNSSEKTVYIMGHSLGLADFGVLRDFFMEKCIGKVTILYHDQFAYENIVINLVKALGRENVVEMIGNGHVELKQLEPAIDGIN